MTTEEWDDISLKHSLAEYNYYIGTREMTLKEIIITYGDVLSKEEIIKLILSYE